MVTVNQDNQRLISELKSLLESSVLKDIILERKLTLQAQLNNHLRKQQHEQAYGELCKIDSLDNLMGIIKTKITNLEKEG